MLPPWMKQHAQAFARKLEKDYAGDPAREAHVAVVKEWLRLLDDEKTDREAAEALKRKASALPDMGAITLDIRLHIGGYTDEMLRRKDA